MVDYKAGSGELMLSQPGYSASFGNSVNNWDVTLNGDVPLEIIGHLGAGEANLELGTMNLSRVELTIGAGEMNVDLRGEPKRDYTVQIRGGVGETTVHLPKDVGSQRRPRRALATSASTGSSSVTVCGSIRIASARSHSSPRREGRRREIRLIR